jgi:hypothetical protein
MRMEICVRIDEAPFHKERKNTVRVKYWGKTKGKAKGKTAIWRYNPRSTISDKMREKGNPGGTFGMIQS